MPPWLSGASPFANANWYWFNREPVVTTVRDYMDVLRTETQQIHGPSRFDVRLSVSRDGVNFTRCGGRRPFLSPGPEGSFSSRMIWGMPHPVRVGDELWIYYSGTNRDHDGLIDPAPPTRTRSCSDRALLRSKISSHGPGSSSLH